MASEQKFVAYVCEQMGGAGDISARRMFGEYAIYCGAKVVAFVCDNQLFVKPTPAGQALLETPVQAPPWPGAKAHFLIDDGLDDADWMSRLIELTAAALPAPGPKPRPLKARPPGRPRRAGN